MASAFTARQSLNQTKDANETLVFDWSSIEVRNFQIGPIRQNGRAAVRIKHGGEHWGTVEGEDQEVQFSYDFECQIEQWTDLVANRPLDVVLNNGAVASESYVTDNQVSVAHGGPMEWVHWFALQKGSVLATIAVRRCEYEVSINTNGDTVRGTLTGSGFITNDSFA